MNTIEDITSQEILMKLWFSLENSVRYFLIFLSSNPINCLLEYSLKVIIKALFCLKQPGKMF